MDIWNFILELVSSVAWPIVVLVLAFMMKKPITAIIPGLQRLKYRDLELSFSEGIARLEEDVPPDVSEVPQSEIEINTQDASIDRISQLIVISPRSAIIEIWRLLELTAIKCLQVVNTDITTRVRNPFHLVEMLKSYNLITDHAANFFIELNRMRNQATHSEDFYISAKDARRYVHNALQLSGYLRYQAQEK